MNLTTIVLVGIGGYGLTYVNALLDGGLSDVKIVGCIDPFPEKCPRLNDLTALGVPIYARIEDFYQKHTADLAVISTPIHLHAPQSIFCMEHGSHVLCEKPMTATIQDAAAMIDARERTGKQAYIGYQACFQRIHHTLKRDLITGRYGKILEACVLTLWPRSKAYYARSPWAGAQKMGEHWALDSIAANANAHIPNLLLFLMGSDMSSTAIPVSVTAELYRANPIENFDTCTIHVETDTGATLFYSGSHASETTYRTQSIQCEGAKITMSQTNGISFATLQDGTKVEYISDEPPESYCQKLRDVIAAIRGKETVYATLESARSHVLMINGAYESANVITVPQELICEQPMGDSTQIYIQGIDDILKTCDRDMIFPSQTGAPWARQGKVINMRGYTHFPRRF